jgi:hypothetical protein
MTHLWGLLDRQTVDLSKSRLPGGTYLKYNWLGKTGYMGQELIRMAVWS